MMNITLNAKRARINIILYAFLLMITPFLFLRNYLQDAIGTLSSWSVELGVMNIPVVFSLFLLGVAVVCIIFRKHFTWQKVIVWIVAVVLWALGQKSTDHYLNIEFYGLQNNWHYIAYGIFAYIAYPLFASKKKSQAETILLTYLLAMVISVFDETVQNFISNRVFDISDIAKDLWGVSIGLMVLNFIFCEPVKRMTVTKISLPKLRDYLKNPFPLLVLLFVFTYVLLAVSSLLSDVKYAPQAIFISFLCFGFVFFVIVKTHSKKGKAIALVMGAILFIVQTTSFIINRNKNIHYCSNHLVMYNGWVIPYFDFMVKENGMIKLMDKKKHFNQTDKICLFGYASNILIIGTGQEAIEDIGFPEKIPAQFMFCPIAKKPIQIINQTTQEACESYNRIKKDDKQVTLLIHN